MTRLKQAEELLFMTARADLAQTIADALQDAFEQGIRKGHVGGSPFCRECRNQKQYYAPKEEGNTP
jgi:hypothetical protein